MKKMPAWDRKLNRAWKDLKRKRARRSLAARCAAYGSAGSAKGLDVKAGAA